MTQPVGFSSTLNYTPYEPDLERSEGTGGAGGSPSDGAEGARDAKMEPRERSRFLTPLAALGLLNCWANAAELVECLNEPETKAQGQ